MRSDSSPRVLIFDVETNEKSDQKDIPVHVTVAVARWLDDRDGPGCTCLVLSDDADLKNRFAPLLDCADAIVAYNGMRFDLQVLSNAHFRDEPDRVASWRLKLIDPFEVMRVTTNSWVKLDELLESNGIAKKTGSGLDAIRWWKEGQYDRVARYCEDDVEALKQLLRLDRPLRFPVKTRKNQKVVISSWAFLDWHGYGKRWWSRQRVPHALENVSVSDKTKTKTNTICCGNS